MHRLLSLLAMASGCASPPSAPAPPPMQLTITPTRAFPGDIVDLTLAGAEPNATIVLAISTAGVGQGPCPPALGGTCLELLPPVLRAQIVTADPNGQLSASFPAPPIIDTWGVQALAPGSTPTSSNTTLFRTQPPNTAPTLGGCTINPGAGDATIEWTAEPVAMADPDGDPVVMTVQWQKRVFPTWIDIPDMTFPTRPSCQEANAPIGSPDTIYNCFRGTSLRALCAASDGAELSAEVVSNTVVLENTPPEMTAAEIIPRTPTTNDDLMLRAFASDVDSDSLTFSYEWFVNGVMVSTQDTLPFSQHTTGDSVTAVVRASDPFGPSDPLTTPSVEIL